GGDMPIKAYLDREKYYAYASLNVLQLNDNSNFSLPYILALLNSKLLNWYYAYNFSNKSNLTVNISKTFLEKLPIKNATKEQQNSLSLKAEKMIELNKRLHEETQKALELIKLEYKPKKISQKLEVFYTLGVNPFIEELDKLGVMTPSAEPAGKTSGAKPTEKSQSKSQSRDTTRASKLTLSQKEELISWYKTKSEQLNKIKSEIDTLDHEIDQEVYKLYNLTPEEISIIEGHSLK
ncbi:MAG: hypothetical protein J6P47_03260, partial [Acetobacter sp.]|nr:hypothetical protein [Acetobacter sp.]